jgi:hypothetical protein
LSYREPQPAAAAAFVAKPRLLRASRGLEKILVVTDSVDGWLG